MGNKPWALARLSRVRWTERCVTPPRRPSPPLAHIAAHHAHGRRSRLRALGIERGQMLSLGALRKLCAAFDAVALTVIAAGLSRPPSGRHPFSSAHAHSSHPADFPTIAACRAAISASKGDRRRRPGVGQHSSSPSPSLAAAAAKEEREQPVLVRIKHERDPERLYQLFRANAHNRLLVENRFAFEDAVARLAGARRNDLVEEILEQHKALP